MTSVGKFSEKRYQGCNSLLFFRMHAHDTLGPCRIKITARHRVKITARHRVKVTARHRVKVTARHRVKITARHRVKITARSTGGICRRV